MNEPTVYTIAEAGARTWREAKDMYIDGGLVTAHAHEDGYVSVFVGCAMPYSGRDRFRNVAPGSPAFYALVRQIATDYGMAQEAKHQGANATTEEMADYALTLAFPVGYTFEVRAYIDGWEREDMDGILTIHPRHGDGRNVKRDDLFACGQRRKLW